MAAANIVNLAAVLTEIWQPKDKEDLFYEDSPMYAKSTKKTDWTGVIQHIVFGYGMINGRSATFEDALEMRKPTKKARMNIEPRDEYAVWSLDHKFLTLSRGKGSVIVDHVADESRAAMMKIKRALSWKVWGNGGGAVGRLNTTTITGSATSVTFENSLGARRLEEGDVVVFATTDGTSGSPLDGEMTVSTVDTATNTIGFTSTFTNGCPEAVGSSQLYVFVRGDFGMSMGGFSLFVPRADNTVLNTTCWGLTRTANPRRLGGIRTGVKGLPVEQAATQILKVCDIEGVFSIDAGYLHTDRWQQMYNSLEGKRVIGDDVVNGRVGFKRLEVLSPKGKTVGIYADAEVHPDDFPMLTTNDTYFHSAGAFPDFLTMNREPITEATANAGQYRSGGYGNWYVKNPGKHAVGRFDVAVGGSTAS